jgi:tetratricopeptide (TPR) repeat protein
LLSGQEGLAITVPKGLLPQFLLEANTLVRSGRIEEARALLTEANIGLVEERVAVDGLLTDLMYVLAKLLADVGLHEAAETWYRRILSVDSHAQVWADLAKVCAQGGSRRFGEILTCWEQAHRQDPDNVAFMEAYGDSLVQFGRVAEGVRVLEEIIERHPDRVDLTQRWLWSLHYLPGVDRAFFFDRYTQVGRRYERLAAAYQGPPARTPLDPDRRLRVGIMSGDFRGNSPASAYEPFIEMCDRGAFELFGYANVKDSDGVTDRIRHLFDAYRDVVNRSDDQVAQEIRDDGIDILMEIGGYCAGTRLGVFLLRPAPVQVDLGGISTLGLEGIRYRITDEMLDPPETQGFYTERLVYLPGGLVTYRPPRESPWVGPLPATIHGHATFGSFNNLRKVNDAVLSAWARILSQVPDAIMALKSPTAVDPAVREDLKQRFQRVGIDSDRIRLCGETSYFDHLSLLEQVDVLLDCFPFNGSRTTVEGLWMGVPTVTLTGPTYVAQVGKAIMTRVGLGIFVADTVDEYVAKACAFASQREALGRIRQSLRPQLLSGSLCDPARFTRELEQALRWIWKDTCAAVALHGTRS